MAFVRRVRTASGATAVQIAEYADGRQRIVKHVGSAHTGAELGVLLERARHLLTDPGQQVLDLGVVPTPRVVDLAPDPSTAFGTDQIIEGIEAISKAGSSPRARGRDVVGRVPATGSRVLFDALRAVYNDLGFDVLDDEVFADLVIARIVEPTSLLDTGRVLTDLGQRPASYSTSAFMALSTAPGEASGRLRWTSLVIFRRP